jgi:hypothetical protein
MKSFRTFTFALLFFFCLNFLSSCQQVEIKSNERGVIFKRFDGGLNPEKIYPSGTHIISSWDRIIIYNIDSQTGGEKISILSKDGLTFDLDLSYRFRPIPKEIGNLEMEIGKDYYHIIVKPEMRKTIRELFGEFYLSKNIPFLENEVIEKELFERAKDPIRKRFIELESITINEIGYPSSMKKE